MGKPHTADSGDLSVSDSEGEKGQKTAQAGEKNQTAGSLTQAEQSKLLEDIMALETRIELLHHDYEYLMESLEDEPQSPEIPMVQKPASPWHKRVALSLSKSPLKIARWLVDRPEPKSKKIEPTVLSTAEKKHIAVETLHVQQQLEKLIAERDEKMAKLDAEGRRSLQQQEEKLDQTGKIVDIREFVAKRSARVLELANQGAKAEVGAGHGVAKSIETTGPIAYGEYFKKAVEAKLEKDYQQFVDRLRLTTEQKEKLLSVVSGYEEALATAREFDPDIVAPSKEEVIANILKLGTKKLEKIASIMGKPELIIEPANKSFAEMKDDMDLDVNRHYEQQHRAYFATDYEWPEGPKKVGVSIVDMVQSPAVVPGQQPRKQRNDEQLRVCESYFKEQGMELIHDHQYAMGMQRSLRAYAKAKKNGESNPGKHIIDFYDQPQETVTMFNQEHNSKISKFAYGYFDPERRQVAFDWADPDNRDVALRGRGAVQVL
ncbi:MAG: hypothetical protein WC843_03240 [Candidatus Gracilibacteria bacterium]|jgi:hypothetical protein